MKVSKVYKYPLETIDLQTLSVPYVYRFLDLQMQDDKPCLWFEIDPRTESAPLVIFTFGTGTEFTIPGDSMYLGTYQQNTFIWHVYSYRSQAKE